MNSKCLAVTACIPNDPTITLVKTIGINIMKAAPTNEPIILPSPPIIIMNRTGNDTFKRSNASVSALPSQQNIYKAPATPQKNELMPNANSFACNGRIPIIVEILKGQGIKVIDQTLLPDKKHHIFLTLCYASQIKTSTNL